MRNDLCILAEKIIRARYFSLAI